MERSDEPNDGGELVTITEFLEARIAEDEALARQEDEDYADTTLLPAYDSEHQVNWNTERVLAECVAKRAIIRECRPSTLDDLDSSDDDQPAPMWVARTLAAVYADHSDYQQEWAK